MPTQHESRSIPTLDPDAATNRVRAVPAVVAEAAEAWPDKVALIFGTKTFTFRELEELSRQWLGMLRQAGLRRGDRVLIMLRNCPEYVCAWLGAASGGIVEVPVNTEYKGQTLKHILQDSEAEMIVTAQEFLGSILEVRPERLSTIALIDGRPNDVAQPGVTGVELGAPSQPEDVLESEPIGVMYTSGTTGLSKGALVTHRHAYEYAGAVRHICALRSNDVYFSALPLFHVAGQWAAVYASLQCGATVAVAERFSATTFWDECREAAGTVSFLLGAMAQFLVNQPHRDDDGSSTLDRVLVAPLTNNIDDFRQRFDVQVTTCYGSTESGVPIIGDFEVSDSTAVGRARSGYDLRIVDEHDEEVPIGQVGELVVRPNEPWRTFIAYHGRPEATHETLRNLWLHTGDAMRRDEAGNYFFVDRIKDTIRRRGENLSSFEVEREVLAFDGVAACAAIGVASAVTEQDLVAVVVPEADAHLDLDELKEFLQANAPRFMIPDAIVQVDALPVTPTGKIQKAVLRERFADLTR